MVLIAIALYAAAVFALVRSFERSAGDIPASPLPWLLPALGAIALHAAYHASAWHGQRGADMHFFASLSLVGLGMASLTTLFGPGRRLRTLGVVVFPLAALALVGYHLHGHTPSPVLDWRLQLHAWCALLAYSTLAIAALLAIMVSAQERALRRRLFHGWLRALPPLTELETLLFRTIAVGFALLTATLLTGIVFIDDLLAQHLAHKTALSLLSWLAFGALLIGRWRFGWRGPTAVGWTLAAMALLLLAFSGSQFVLELVLRRTT